MAEGFYESHLAHRVAAEEVERVDSILDIAAPKMNAIVNQVE